MLFCILALGLCGTFASAPAHATTYSPSLYAAMRYRLVGPFRGGRAITVAGIPGDPKTLYFGAVGGGVWKSSNGGRTWDPIFDSQHVASIGAVALAPSDPNIVYVGSGEADMRSDIQAGDGMYRSGDAGKTWTHIGLTDTRQIAKVVVDLHDANVVYVAALGHQYGPNDERGVFKTTDGGRTWNKVLFEDGNTGAIDLSMDPRDSRVLFASLWQTRRPPWNVYPPSNGPGSGLYKTTDGGAHWTHAVGHGFPAKVGHVGIAISPADSSRVYAQVDTDNEATGGVYRSDDAGVTWVKADPEMRIWKRGWYFGQIVADPKNRDRVYTMNTSTYRSDDAGKTFDAIKGAPGGDDYHALWIDPQDTSRLLLGGDQGVLQSEDGARTWTSWFNQPTAQLYHVAVDNRFPYWIYGAQQDSGGVAVPSRSRHRGISQLDWRPLDAPGESGYAAPDPLHPGTVFGSNVSKENVDLGGNVSVDPTVTFPGTIWRSTWTLPLVFSQADPHALYFAHQRIFRTRDGGKSWSLISPDLTRRINTVPSTLDPATVADSTGLARRGVVYAIAPSPVRANTIWAGTDDGLIWLTRDGGRVWNDVTPHALTPWSKVAILDASHFDAQTAYAAVDRHRLEDRKPYIYRTHDGGAHWTLVTSGIPSGSFVNVVREDPKRKGLLYAGTEYGMYASFDDGDSWQPLQANLPTASVRDIAFRNDDMAIATHGRSFWIMDDVTPLRDVSAAASSESAYLYPPAPAYRLNPGTDEGTPVPLDEAQGENPPTGAILDYVLKRAGSPVTIDISDWSGKIVRHYSSTDKPIAPNPRSLDIPAYWIHPVLPPSSALGHNRFVWDLHDGTRNGPMVPPGRYRVTLSANGKRFSQPLTILADPRLHATATSLKQQYALAMRIESAQTRLDRFAKAFGARKNSAAFRRNEAQLTHLFQGTAPTNTPDDSVGKPSHDFSSLFYVRGALQGLEQQVESGDGAPTPDDYSALHQIEAVMASTMAKIESLAR